MLYSNLILLQLDIYYRKMLISRIPILLKWGGFTEVLQDKDSKHVHHPEAHTQRRQSMCRQQQWLYMKKRKPRPFIPTFFQLLRLIFLFNCCFHNQSLTAFLQFMCGWHLFSIFQELTRRACLAFLSPSFVPLPSAQILLIHSFPILYRALCLLRSIPRK